MIRSGTLLAFDVGSARIGVAMGEASLGIAHPLETIASERNSERFTRIQALIREWQPVALVVGLPTHMDGTHHATTALAQRFAQRLHGRFALPVWLVDERLTSLDAASRLKELGMYGKKQKTALDQVAALLILETFFAGSGTELILSGAIPEGQGDGCPTSDY